MPAHAPRKVLAASFLNPDAGSHAAAAVAAALPGKVGNTAVLVVGPEGSAKFTESKDWGAGHGAFVGGAIGLIMGPLGMVAGGGIGALAAKLRDSGFKDDQLERLGTTLAPDCSAVVIEIDANAVSSAQDVLTQFDVDQTLVQEVDASIATLFRDDPEPTPQPRS